MGQNKGLHITIDALSNPSSDKGGLLPIDGLTEHLQRLIKNVAEALQSPEDYVTASMFTVASAATNLGYALLITLMYPCYGLYL